MEAEPPEASPAKRKRRWYEFSLRSLLIFTLICANGSAFVVHRMEQRRREQETAEAVLRIEGQTIGFTWLNVSLSEN